MSNQSPNRSFLSHMTYALIFNLSFMKLQWGGGGGGEGDGGFPSATYPFLLFY